MYLLRSKQLLFTNVAAKPVWNPTQTTFYKRNNFKPLYSHQKRSITSNPEFDQENEKLIEETFKPMIDPSLLREVGNDSELTEEEEDEIMQDIDRLVQQFNGAQGII